MRKKLAAGAAGGLAIVLVLLLANPVEGLSIDGYFSDDNGHLFENDIDAIADVGITKGCNPPANTNFCPGLSVDRGAMAAFLRRALNLPSTSKNYFTDDDNSVFENDINAIAEAGITKGCNPPANDHYCPNNVVDRSAMAAFLRRAFDLPFTSTDYFTDDDGSLFENDINSIAEAGITKGCNPPANDLYRPRSVVDRGAMAAFLRRARGLPFIILEIPLADHGAIICEKDGENCGLTVDVVAGRTYSIEEGLFQVIPASGAELARFADPSTRFELTVDGSGVGVTLLPEFDDGNFTIRNWRKTLTFSSGNHTLVGRWRWDGDIIRTTTVTVRASN